MHPPCQPHPLPLSHPPDLDTTGENTTSENFQLTSSDGPSSPSPASPRRRWVPKPLFLCSSAPSGPRVLLPPELHPLIHYDPLGLPASAHHLSPLSPPCAHLVKPKLRSNSPNQPLHTSAQVTDHCWSRTHSHVNGLTLSSRCPRVLGGLTRTAVADSATPGHRLSFLSSNCPCPLLQLHSQMAILSGILPRK